MEGQELVTSITDPNLPNPPPGYTSSSKNGFTLQDLGFLFRDKKDCGLKKDRRDYYETESKAEEALWESDFMF